METQRSKMRKISDDLLTYRGNSGHLIPPDLIQDILVWLPAKTLIRFLCVSKQFESIIRSRDFMKSHLLKSSTRPQTLIFTFSGLNSKNRFFFSLLKPQDVGDESKSVLTYLMNCPSLLYGTIASVHGLICHGPPSQLIVSNPSTRRSIMLPKIDSESISFHHHLGYDPSISFHHHLGYDPISGDVKVLCMMKGMHVSWGCYLAHELRVLTLAKGASWSMIKDFPPHCLATHDTPDLCINGVLYYLALLDTALSLAVMCFDVRSETFDLIKGPEPFLTCPHTKLIRYEGKVALLLGGRGGTINLWVLQDSAKHEWSKKKSYVLSITDINTYIHHRPFCTSDAGEIVLAPDIVSSKPFYVLFYHPQKGTMRRVHIEGIKGIKTPLWDKDTYHITTAIFPGQVDNLMFLSL